MIFCMVLMDLPNIQELRSAIPHGITDTESVDDYQSVI